MIATPRADWQSDWTYLFGGVSRGVCTLDSTRYLTEVRETFDLKSHGDGITGSTARDERRSFSGREIVSMNMWGFTPHVFTLLESRFREFLANHEHDPETEFLLPDAMNAAITARTAQVAVLQSQERWFGVTYPEDVESVRKALRDLHDTGRYPNQLFMSVGS